VLRDALMRAEVYRNAGADAIMIHNSALPNEVLSFLTKYRSKDSVTPLVVVPTTYSETTEDVLYDARANVIIIYANHLMRAKICAMGEFSDKFLAETPDFISRRGIERLSGCLSRKMLALKDLGEEAKQYQAVMEKHATENMNAVAKCQCSRYALFRHC